MRPPTGERASIALEGHTLIYHHRLHAALMAPLYDPVCSPEGFPRMQGEKHGCTQPETDDSVASVPDGVGLVASWAFSPTDGPAHASGVCRTALAMISFTYMRSEADLTLYVLAQRAAIAAWTRLCVLDAAAPEDDRRPRPLGGSVGSGRAAGRQSG